MHCLKYFARVFINIHTLCIPGGVAQLVMCLTAYVCLTANPGVTSLIPVRSHTLVEIDHEIISTVILLPFAESRRVVIRNKPKYSQTLIIQIDWDRRISFEINGSLYDRKSVDPGYVRMLSFHIIV